MLLVLGTLRAADAPLLKAPAEPQVGCTGPLSGIWTNSAAFKNHCSDSCGGSWEFTRVDSRYVCQQGANLSGKKQYTFKDYTGSVLLITEELVGTVAGNQVHFKISYHYTGKYACVTQDFDDYTGVSGQSGTTISGNFSGALNYDCVPEYTGCGGCTSSGSFNVSIGSGTQPPSVKDVSQSSGIANQNVATTGVQWIDYNGDTRLDLFLVGSNGTALFKNIGAGKFQNVTVQAKITNDGRAANGASWADIDNDGDLDVFIANATGPPTLLLNNHGVFQDISNNLRSPGSVEPAETGITRAGIWIDINNDKDIDLLIIKDGGPNQLFKKKGLTFTNIASSAGLAAVSTGRSAVAFDANQDGFQDLYVVNFIHPNKLYLNNKNETFSDISTSAGVGFSGGSVQAAVADYDRDKNLDLFVVNNSGPSILYKNLGNLKFANATPSVMKTAKKGIAAAFADIDLDGNQDLILAQTAGGNKLFQNQGNGVFVVVAGLDLSNPDNPTGVTVGDFNGDGLPDIAIGDGDEGQDHGDSLYQNTGGGGANFLQLTLVGTNSNRAAIGARVIVQTGLTFQAKEVSSGNGQSQGSLPMNFGLGVAQLVDTIQVYWPGGAVQTLTNVPVNRKLTVTQTP